MLNLGGFNDRNRYDKLNLISTHYDTRSYLDGLYLNLLMEQNDKEVILALISVINFYKSIFLLDMIDLLEILVHPKILFDDELIKRLVLIYFQVGLEETFIEAEKEIIKRVRKVE